MDHQHTGMLPTPPTGITNVSNISNNNNDNNASNSNASSLSTTIAPDLPNIAALDLQGGDRVVWEFQQVTLNRVPGYGFGIAVSGGRDNPHFANGDPSIAVSDVLKAGPAEGKLMVNDRITSANGISLENVDYGRAVQVLRDSGNTVTLSVRRRLLLPSQEPHILRVQLSKSRKKDDFGIALGNRIYIKDVGNRAETVNGGPTLQEGDIVLKINNQPADNLSVKEAKKLIESSKEKLHLTVRREARSSPYSQYSPQAVPGYRSKDNNYVDGLGAHYGTAQNLYVQPPTRQHHGSSPSDVEKSNLRAAGRSRNPLLDVSLSQLDRPASPLTRNLSADNVINGGNSGSNSRHLPSVNHIHSHSHAVGNQENSTDGGISSSQLGNYHHSRSRSAVDGSPDPSRPPLPPPRPEDYYGMSRPSAATGHEDEDTMHPSSRYQSEEPRFIAFHKEGSVGIRLIGGNEVGIFVTAVQPGSPASAQGLQPADKILKANDFDMKGVTREEAVLFLLNVQDQVHLIVQTCQDEYEHVLTTHLGDSFHIKAHFDYDQPSKGEMGFRKSDVFHVVDTLHNGIVGSWQVYRIGRNNQEVQKGVIPNKARAEELATAQFNATKKELTATESRISFFRRKRNNHRRSKSLSKDHWDDVVFGDSVSKFPAYERVVLKHPGFIRPVVLFGPVADIAREKLLKDFADKFSSPQSESPLDDLNKKTSSIIRLSAIRDIMERGKHALLDITPNAVDRLNYAQFYPIVILLRAESKHVVKELRAGVPKTAHKSSRKLFEQGQKLEKVWSHVFSGSVTLSGPDSWYRKLRELIEKHQSSPVWISESKPEQALSDDFLFPMASLRLSYASSPESDLDQSTSANSVGLLNLSPASAIPPRLVKCSSDPSISTQDDNTVPSYNPPPPYSPSIFKQTAQELDQKLRHHRHEGYTYPPPPSALVAGEQVRNSGDDRVNCVPNGDVPPDLPPRVDRASKPMARGGGGGRSAHERLFGAVNTSREMLNGEPPNYINATTHHNHRSTNSVSLERRDSVGNSGNKKLTSYDSGSSYDSYTQRLAGNMEQNFTEESKMYSTNERNHRSNNGPYADHHERQVHDPYRFTRSTQQPIKYNGIDPALNLGTNYTSAKSSKPPDYLQYRPPGLAEYATNKPLPPPKAPPIYKPVPPPKPKNYRPPVQHSQQMSQPYYQQHATIRDVNSYQHSKSYSMAEEIATNYNGTRVLNGGIGSSSSSKYSAENSDSNGFDSGHGSSLDRSTYDRRTNIGNAVSSQYYYNVVAATSTGSKHHYRELSGGLDLMHHRDQRGSAFELYKKPSGNRNIPYYPEHTVR